MITLAQVNAMDAAEFVVAFGDVAEHSIWVAEGAYAAKAPLRRFAPPPSLRGEDKMSSSSPLAEEVTEGRRRAFSTRAALIAAFTHTVMSAPHDLQLSLLRAHPDLATRAKLTVESTEEQKDAGLDSLCADELAKFTMLNDQYKAQNGFPFILAVKGATKHQILESFEQRIHQARDAEFRLALQQVCKIIGFRLAAKVME